MDVDPRSATAGGRNAALVILAFLQTDGGNTEYRKELLSLGNDFNLTRDINHNGPGHDHHHHQQRSIDSQEDGDLETDGHLPSSPPFIRDLEPSVELQWLIGNHAAPAELQRIAAELREIGDQLEQDLVARATGNLRRNISTSPAEHWRAHLTWEVERVMRQGCVGLEQLPQERVLMALTLTLVRRVCEQAPHFLRNLFNAALQYFSPAARPR